MTETASTHPQTRASRLGLVPTSERKRHIDYVVATLLFLLNLFLIVIVELRTRVQVLSYIVLTVLIPGVFIVFYFKVTLAILWNDRLRNFVYVSVVLSSILPTIYLIKLGNWVWGRGGALLAFILAMSAVIIFFGAMNRSITSTWAMRQGSYHPRL